MTAEHISPHPPSRTGYTYYRCRCADCREAQRVAQAKARARKGTRSALRPKADNRANVLAARWMRQHVPAEYEKVRRQAEIDVGIDQLPAYAERRTS